MTNWKTLSSKQLIDHPRITLYEDEVQLPNGHKTTYLRYGDTGGAAFVIATNDDDKVLVQIEYSYPTNSLDYHFPAGALHLNEDPKIGAARELAEEASLQGDLVEIGWLHTYNRRSADKSFVYAATNLQRATAAPDPEESIQHQWLAPADIDALIASGKVRNQGFLAVWCLFKGSTAKN